MSVQTRSLGLYSVLLVIAAVILGTILALKGKPYNTAIFTVHKLTALGAVILAVILCINLLKNISAVNITGALVIAAVSVLALFATGALMSAGVKPHSILRIVHIISTILLTVVGGGALLTLLGRLR